MGNGGLMGKIKEEEPFDLLALQECDNPNATKDALGYSDWEIFPTDNKKWCGCRDGTNRAQVAWNTKTWENVSSPEVTQLVVENRYGKRDVTTVKLKHKKTGKVVLFGNTHGPLDHGARGEDGLDYPHGLAKAMKDRKTDDVNAAFLCGDFNTGGLGPVREVLHKSIGSGIDFCLSTQDGDGGKKNGS